MTYTITLLTIIIFYSQNIFFEVSCGETFCKDHLNNNTCCCNIHLEITSKIDFNHFILNFLNCNFKQEVIRIMIKKSQFI